jgi:ABC-2 type transport system ATP-binding protein
MGAESGRLALAAPDGITTLLAAADALQAEGFAVTDVSLRQPTLDEAFLALTGAAVAG